MLRNLFIASLALLLTVSFAGCGDMLNAQAAKDKDLGKMVEENLSTGQFRSNFVSFAFDGEAGQYRCKTKDLADAKAVGDYAYNIMAVLVERNNSKVQTGRDHFKIIGEQDGTVIFEVTYAVGAPRIVTLKGPYEGQEYSPNVGR